MFIIVVLPVGSCQIWRCPCKLRNSLVGVLPSNSERVYHADDGPPIFFREVEHVAKLFPQSPLTFVILRSRRGPYPQKLVGRHPQRARERNHGWRRRILGNGLVAGHGALRRADSLSELDLCQAFLQAQAVQSLSDFWGLKVDFWLDRFLATGGPKRATPAAAAATGKPDPHVTVRRQKLLGRVAAYYRHCFSERVGGREYLGRRAIGDNIALEAYGAGFCDGTLLSIAPDDAGVRDDLKALGILSDSGRELFDNCVVFPLLDEARAVVGMYGRRLVDGEVNHLYLPGPRRGLVSRAGAQGRTLLCEAIIDALTLSCHGVAALPCFGTQGFTDEHLSVLNRPAVEEILVCFDDDDVNSLVVRDGIDRIRALLGTTDPARTTAPARETSTSFEATPHFLASLRR
jgi:hypothetical protein